MTTTEIGGGSPILGLWAYLSSWLSADGGVTGPVVHRGDLTRMFSVHDTAWTQQAVILGLLQLYQRSGETYWLTQACKLGDAQCARLLPDGRFRWSGHEDDRFAALVSNALADSALLEAAAVLRQAGDRDRSDRYVDVAEANIERYLIGSLYREAMPGFAMNPVDHYVGHDRFIVNMNSLAQEAIIRLDELKGDRRHETLVQKVGAQMLSMQADGGPCDGGFPYSDRESDEHVSLYTALTLRGIKALARYDTTQDWPTAAARTAAWLDRAIDTETGLWIHVQKPGGRHRSPVFVAGAGMICNGRLDGAEIAGQALDTAPMVQALLQHQYPNGAISNFVGYDHPDNGLRKGTAEPCWEDIFPTTNWNAQAFHFLCRVLPPPPPPEATNGSLPLRATRKTVSRACYLETRHVAAILGWWPPGNTIAALYIKGLRYGLVIPGALTVVRRLARYARQFALGRALLARRRALIDRRRQRQRNGP